MVVNYIHLITAREEYCKISFQRLNLLSFTKSPWFLVCCYIRHIIGCATELPFAELPVLVCADLYQLPPVKGTPVHCNTGNIKGFFSLELWRGFKIAELTKVMRQ